jgi:hypothetical protein
VSTPNVVDESAEQHAEECVTRRRAREDPRAGRELRPGAVATLRVDAVEEADARPEDGVLDNRGDDAGTHATASEPLEEMPEQCPAHGMGDEVCDRLERPSRDEGADQLGVAVRGVEGALQERIAGLPRRGGDGTCKRTAQRHQATLIRRATHLMRAVYERSSTVL